MLWALCATIGCFSIVSQLYATDSTWITATTGGTWSVTSNWSGGNVADGADATADFSQLGLSAANTVNMDASHTLGYLIFADTTNRFGWTLSNAPSTSNTLTLQTTAPNTTPTITVQNQTTTINVALSGAQGLIKNGTGTLALGTGAGAPSGNVVINAGTLTFSGTQSASTSFVLNAGASINCGTNANVGAVTLPGNTIYVNCAGATTATLGGNGWNNGSTGNQLQCALTGNGNLNWNCGNLSVINNAGLFQNYGGIINWGASNNTIRVNSGGTTITNAQFAEINLGTGRPNIFPKSGTASSLVLGAITGGPATAVSMSLDVGSANASTTYSGAVTGTLTEVGIGTLTLAPTISLTSAATNVNGGVLRLSLANSPTGVFSPTNATAFTGGTLYLQAKLGSSSTQLLGNVTLNAGGGALVLDGNGGSMTLNVSALPNTGTPAGASLNISTIGTTSLTTTTAPLPAPDGSYSARITYGTDWATSTSLVSPYTISAFTNYTATPSSGTTDTTNDRLIDGMTLAGNYTTNQLKIATTQNGQSLNLGGNSLALTAGGLLFAGSNDYQINGGTLQSGTASGSDLILHELGSGKLTINAAITDNPGSSTLTKTGPGTLVLGASNTYTGASWIEGGVTSISQNANLGDPGTGAQINMTGGTLQATSTFGLNNGGAGINDRAIVIYGGGGTFDVTASNALTISGVVSNINGSNLGPLVKTGPGTLVLANGANTYGGATIINGGVLSVGTLANGGLSSSVGTSSAAAPALVFNGGILQYTGAGASTDRSFVLTTNGGGIDASGSGPLVFSTTSSVMLLPAPIVVTGPLAGSGPRTLTLTGTNTGQNVFAGQILDGTGGATSLLKSAPGQWVLTNNNTYTGTTTVNGGTLALSALSSNPIPNSSTISVGSGATLDVTSLSNSTFAANGGQTITGPGTINGSVSLAAGASLAPGAISSGLAGVGTITINTSMTLANNSNSLFGLNGSNGTANLANVLGTLTLPGSGTPVNVSLFAPNTSTPFSPPLGTSTYDLFQYGSLNGSVSELSVANPNSAFSYTFGTASVGGASYVDLVVTQIHTFAIWATNGPGNWSSSANWTGGVPQAAGDTATFSSAITSPATVTLDQPETVGAVTFANTASYTISGTNTLTLSNTGGASITDAQGSHKIAAPVNLASNTSVSVAGGTTLTLSGAISGPGSLSVNGGGTLVLANSNNYGPTAGSVGTRISAGTVQVANNAAFSTGDVSIAGNATILATANGLSLANNFIIASSANASFVANTQGNTLTLGGVISESAPTGALTANGGGLLILTGSNTFTGATTVASGTLQIDNGGSNGSIAGPIVNNGTLLTDRSDTGLLLAGAISGGGNLTQIGAGMATLGGANTFSGPTVISAGTLALANAAALQNSTLNYNNQGGVLSFGTLTAATLGNLTGSQNLSLLNVSAGAVTLTVGNNNSNATYTGDLSGAGGSLVKTGNGTFTLTGSNEYTGSTAVNLGTLLIAPSAVVNTTTANTANGASLLVQGGTLTSSGLTTIGTTNLGGGIFNISSGVAAFNGGMQGTNADGGLISVSGGSFSASSIALIRTANPGAPSASGIPPTIPTTSGFYVSGGTANIGTLTISTGASSNSSATARIDGGVVNASGAIVIGNEAANTRWNYLQVRGGALTSSDTTSGIVIGQCGGTGGTESIQAELYLSGGTTTAQRIAFGTPSDAAGGTSNLAINGGLLYLGAGGLSLDNSTGLTTNIYLAAGTFGLVSDLSSSLSMQLTGSTTAGINLQAADATGAPHNFTLNGVISGSGAFTKTGPGTLTLGGFNSYSGNTVINAGSVVASNAFTLSPNSTVILNNGLLDPSAGSQTISGLTINGGSVNLNSAVTLTTLTMSATGAYTLAAGASGSLALNAGGIAATGGSQSLLAPTTLTSGLTNISVTGSGRLNIGDSLIDGTGGLSAVSFSSSDGTGLLVLSGSNNFGGGFTVLSGTAIVATPASLADGSNLNVGPGSPFLAPIVPSAAVPASAAPSAVPEPASGALLLGILLGGWVGYRVRLRKSFQTR
jgi:autotransporter-associated beta strand protein